MSPDFLQYKRPSLKTRFIRFVKSGRSGALDNQLVRQSKSEAHAVNDSLKARLRTQVVEDRFGILQKAEGNLWPHKISPIRTARALFRPPAHKTLQVHRKRLCFAYRAPQSAAARIRSCHPKALSPFAAPVR